MLSLILYGRNDSHGYNLHKRAAISLNCLAEVLDGDDDEIIFVDYNSQDLTPTFPEAIADTLTDKTKQKLRIIRVRPSYHRQFLGKTHLQCLEPQSRNIAVRRMNPRNRWILSTNTDMIFVPRKEGLSLTRALENLPPHVYHLSRFETPECLWEELDRRDPITAIQAMRTWGKTLRLNEIVYGAVDNIYEAPGDFQLVTRDDYDALCGFDESMILGWHADSNFARRVRLYKGEIRSAGEHVFGYHCSHTRLPTLLHDSQRRKENSQDKYVHNVHSYAIDEQADGRWGAPDHDFEEVRLSARRSIAPVLCTAIGDEGPESQEVTLRQETFDTNDYDSGHVLPHLMNLLSQSCPGTKILISGYDPELFKGLVGAFSELGTSPVFLIPENDAAELPEQSGVEVRRLAQSDAIAAANIFIVQNPRATLKPAELKADLEWRAQTILENIFEVEQARPFADRRLIVIVNGVHTRLKDTIEMNMSFSQMPYTTRIAHGVAMDRTKYPGYQPPPPGSAYSLSDRKLLSRLAIGIVDSDPVPGWERLADELIRFAEAETEFVEATGLAPENAQAVATAAKDAMNMALAGFPSHGHDLRGRAAIGQRLCSSADWDDPEWRRTAERYFGGPAVGDLEKRSRWTWERVTIACELRRLVSPENRPRILLVTPGPDYAACMLAHMGFDVTYASVDALLQQKAEDADWRGAFEHFNVILPSAHRPWNGKLERADFAAVAVTGAVLSSLAGDQARQFGFCLDALCGRDTPVVASFLTDLMGSDNGLVEAANIDSGFEAGGVFARAKLGSALKRDWRIPRDTQLRYAPDDTTDPVSGLSFGYSGRHVTVGVVTALTGKRPWSRDALSLLLEEAPRRMERQPPARAIARLSRDVTHLVAAYEAPADDAKHYFLAVNPGPCRNLTIEFAQGHSDLLATVYVARTGQEAGSAMLDGETDSRLRFTDVPSGVPAIIGFAMPAGSDLPGVALYGE